MDQGQDRPEKKDTQKKDHLFLHDKDVNDFYKRQVDKIVGKSPIEIEKKWDSVTHFKTPAKEEPIDFIRNTIALGAYPAFDRITRKHVPVNSAPSYIGIGFEEILIRATLNFTTVHGTSKTQAIIKKVFESNKVSGSISKCLYNRLIVDCATIISIIYTIPYFIVAKRECGAIAGLLFLHRWNEEVNNKLLLLDGQHIDNIARDIIIKTKMEWLVRENT